MSSEYIFDGTQEPHTEDEVPSPLGVYGQSKAGGDAAVAGTPRHYLVRTSWVVGDGKNFVKTMASLAAKGVKPSVVADQTGRLTFTADLAAGIIHLLVTCIRRPGWTCSRRRDRRRLPRPHEETAGGDDEPLRRSTGRAPVG